MSRLSEHIETGGGRSDGVELLSVRLSLEAVALWWLAGGRPFSGSPGMFFGVAVPLDGN